MKICKGYTLVFSGYSEATSLGEMEDVSLCQFVYCVLVIYGITVRSSMSPDSMVFHIFKSISSSSAAFLFLIFLVMSRVLRV